MFEVSRRCAGGNTSGAFFVDAAVDTSSCNQDMSVGLAVLRDASYRAGWRAVGHVAPQAKPKLKRCSSYFDSKRLFLTGEGLTLQDFLRFAAKKWLAAQP